MLEKVAEVKQIDTAAIPETETDVLKQYNHYIK
jgi:hypothetical protein